MRRIIIESPYAGQVGLNEAYARAAAREILLMGDAPFLSHLLYTQPGILDDTVAIERAIGMKAGFYWMRAADAVAVYGDLGVSYGMKQGIENAKQFNIPVEYRWLPVDLVRKLRQDYGK